MTNPIYRAEVPDNWAGAVERGALPEPGKMGKPNVHAPNTTGIQSGTPHQGESGVASVQPWNDGPFPTANVDQGNTVNNWDDLADLDPSTGRPAPRVERAPARHPEAGWQARHQGAGAGSGQLQHSEGHQVSILGWDDYEPEGFQDEDEASQVDEVDESALVKRDGTHLPAQPEASYADASGNEAETYEHTVRVSGLSDAEQLMLIDQERRARQDQARAVLAQQTTPDEVETVFSSGKPSDIRKFFQDRGLNFLG